MASKKTLALLIVRGVGVYLHFSNRSDTKVEPLSNEELRSSLSESTETPRSLSGALEKMTIPSQVAPEVVMQMAEPALSGEEPVTQMNAEDLARLRLENPAAFVNTVQNLLNSTMTSEIEKRDFYINELSMVLPDQAEKVADLVISEMKLNNFAESDRIMSPRESERLERLTELFFSAEKDRDKLITGVVDAAGLLSNPTLQKQLLLSFSRQFPDYFEELQQRINSNLTVPIENVQEEQGLDDRSRMPSSSRRLLRPQSQYPDSDQR